MTELGRNMYQEKYDKMRRDATKSSMVDRRQVKENYNQKLPFSTVFIPSDRGFDDRDMVKEGRDKVRFNKSKTLFEDKEKYGYSKLNYI